MRGGFAKTVEDHATSMPILGPAIQDARTEGLRSFNKAVVNRALKPLGETLPADIPAGTDAVKYAGDTLSAAYDKVLPEIGFTPDAQFAGDLKKISPITETMSAGAQEALKGIVDKRLGQLLRTDNGVLAGDRFKQVESGLNFEIDRFSGSQDPDHRAMFKALTAMKTALQSAAERQNPIFAAQKGKIDAGWAELTRIETAASKSGADGGVFTPTQYEAAVRSGDNRVRRRGMARGEARGQDMSTAAKAVLPSKVPDSGSGGRIALMHVAAQAPGAVIGAVTGGGVGALGGIAATTSSLAALSTRYSPKAIEAANVALNARIAAADRQGALSELARLATHDPRVRELYTQVIRSIGVAGGAQASPRNIYRPPATP
jgi:hypothetical protein